ncbi:MAG: NTP transferase domain-containing protein [Anaerohalosphaeraceae bacterium]
MTVQITAIIPAAGQGQRWNRAFGTLKQLVPVCDNRQPLLIRTIQMLRDRGVGTVYVLTREPEIVKAAAGSAEVLPPAADRYLSDTILSSRSVWSEKTVVLLGDVYFSSACIDSIVRFEQEHRFWGIGHGSAVCRNNLRRPELFAFSFLDSAYSEVEKSLRENSLLAELRDKGRMFWRALGCGRKIFIPFFRQNYSPKPSHWFRERGFRGNDFWRAYRCWQRKQPVYAYQYGKLWGLYRLLDRVDPFGSPDYKWPQDQSGHFVQVEDQTQDIDSPEDYQQLCLLWNGSIQAMNQMKDASAG